MVAENGWGGGSALVGQPHGAVVPLLWVSFFFLWFDCGILRNDSDIMPSWMHDTNILSEQSVMYIICLVSRLWAVLPIPRMSIPLSPAAFILMVTGVRSARVRPRRPITRILARQLWQLVSAITEEINDFVLVRILKPKSVQSSALAERVRRVYGSGFKACLVHLSFMLLYRWWSRVMGRALFQW